MLLKPAPISPGYVECGSVLEVESLLLAMLPLKGEHGAVIEDLIARHELIREPGWLPEGISQGHPPPNLEHFALPATVYEARGWILDKNSGS